MFFFFKLWNIFFNFTFLHIVPNVKYTQNLERKTIKEITFSKTFVLLVPAVSL